MRTSDHPVAAARPGAWLLGSPTLCGLSLALLFWWHAQTPTLIPRTWATQAVIGAISLAAGYGIGTLGGRWGHRLLDRWRRAPGPATRRRGWIVLAVGWPIGVFLGAVLWVGWQNEQRGFMGMAPVGWSDAVLMVGLCAAAGALFVALGRAAAAGAAAVTRFNRRHVPAVLAAPATVLLIAVLGIGLGGGVAVRALTALANAYYGAVDERTNEGTVVPDSPSVSGSGASLVAWGALGRMGRDFVGSAPTARDLERFHGAGAELTVPVRVYVGLRAADSAAERAQLAVRELERAGGFERDVLVVWVPTGSGWMIPEAAAALEQLHRGDTAIVAVQYSFLPSLLSVFLDPGLATEAGSTLFGAVHARWSALPPDRRPQLVVFGKSLGTAGVEAPFAAADAPTSVANLVARTDGALIVGAKRSNPILSQLTRARDPGSPVWQPIVDRGRSVRFVNRAPQQRALAPEWPAPRIIYLQHPSDPVTFWGVEALWRPPDWMDRPRGFDVPAGARWFPVVSGVQAVADLLYQLSPPPGFGHVYSTDYVDGWARVVPPDGWADADTERLEHFLNEQFLSDPGAGEVEP
jgi:uncharacterized membrane protein